MPEWTKNNDALGTANRGVPCESGLCTLCRADCKGKCEVWLSCIVGRKLLYPRDFGKTTAGSANVTSVGTGYHALRIHGYPYGAKGLPQGLSNDPDDCIFPNVSFETSFGQDVKTKCRIPIMTGALGSTFIASNYWDAFAMGAAICGFPIVVGENVVGVDRKSEIKKGKILSAPELDRRIDTFRRYYDGYGAIIVQLNVEDTRNGVAEYLANKYGDAVIIELKWGQGAKDIGGEIQVTWIMPSFSPIGAMLSIPTPTIQPFRKLLKTGPSPLLPATAVSAPPTWTPQTKCAKTSINPSSISAVSALNRFP
jgi:hypothetical protein